MIPSRPRAVVTGAAGGLGRSFAIRLAARGGKLVLSDIDEAGLAETKRLVDTSGGSASVMRCDVSKIGDVEQLFARAEDVLGGTDLLINNAGVAVGGPVGKIPLADWEWIMGINLWGVIYGCHTFLPKMKERRSGHILNVASIAAFANAGEMGPYNTTKAAVVALSETLAGELEGTGVGATVLCPFFFRTNIAKSSRSHSERAPDFIEKLMAKNPIQSDDVAELALAGCEADELYVFPHREAKVIQAIKRLAPSTFLKRIGPRAARRKP